jgi:hypothetical protein
MSPTAAAPSWSSTRPTADVRIPTWVPPRLGPALSWHLAHRPEVAHAALVDVVDAGERWPVCRLVVDDTVPPPIRRDTEIAMRQRLDRAIGDAVQPWFVALDHPLLQRVHATVPPFYVRGATGPLPADPPPPGALLIPALERQDRLQELVDLGLLTPAEAALHRPPTS